MDTCWFVVTDDGRFDYATSFFADGRISSYRTSPGGGLQLLGADAAEGVEQGASDLSLSRDSRHLYQFNSLRGTISAFRVEGDGRLRRLQTVTATGPSPMAARLGLTAT